MLGEVGSIPSSEFAVGHQAGRLVIQLVWLPFSLSCLRALRALCGENSFLDFLEVPDEESRGEPI
jgi:hypothetical protein